MLLVHTARTLDPATRLPIAVIDSTELKGELPTVDELVSNIASLPASDYVLLFFASGVQRTPNPAWFQRAYKALDHDTKKRVKRVYIVHGGWWTKAMLKVMNGILSPKFCRKTVFLPSLSALAMHVDITLLDISPAVYLANLDCEESITIPKHIQPVFGAPLSSLPGHAWRSCIAYLSRLPVLEPAQLDPVCCDPDLLQVLCDAVDRSQVLKLRDYGPEIVLGALRTFLVLLPDPLLPLAGTEHLSGQTLAHARDIVEPLSPAQGQHLALLLKWANRVTSERPGLEEPMVTYFALPLFGVRAASQELADACKLATRNLIRRYSEIICEEPDPLIDWSASPAAAAVDKAPPLPPRSPPPHTSSPRPPPSRTTSAESALPYSSIPTPNLGLCAGASYSPGDRSPSPSRHLLRQISPDIESRPPAPPPPRSTSPDRRSLSDDSSRPLREVNSNMVAPLPLAPPLLPPVQTLRAQKSTRSIRGERVAQLALHFEPDKPAEDSPFA